MKQFWTILGALLVFSGCVGLADGDTHSAKACVNAEGGMYGPVYDTTPSCQPDERQAEWPVSEIPPTTTSTSTSTTTSTTTTTLPPTTTTVPLQRPTLFPRRYGVGASGNLTDVRPTNGVLIIRQPTVLQNEWIHGGIDCYSACTLNNVYVESDTGWWGNIVVRKDQNPPATLNAQNCTIDPGPTPTTSTTLLARGQDGVLDQSTGAVSIRQCEIAHTGKGSLTDGNFTMEDSWVHSLTPYYVNGAPTHKGGVMSMGGDGFMIRRNRLEECDPTTVYSATTNPDGFASDTQTGSILLQPWGNITNVTIADNFLECGYYTLRMEGTQTTRKINGTVSGVSVTGNVFGPYPLHGYYWTTQPGSTAAGVTAWSDNVVGDKDGIPSSVVVAGP